MFSAAPKCRPVDAPSMAVPPEPLLVADHELRIAYRASTDPGGEERWVVVRFPGYLHIRHGYPNDEALGAHRLTKYGLGFYGVFQVDRSPLVEEIEKRNAIHPRHIKGMFLSHRHWI